MDSLSGLLERHAGRLALLATLLVLLLPVWSLSRALWELYETVLPANPAELGVAEPDEAQPTSTRDAPDAMNLSQLSLFGVPEAETPASPVQVSAPATHLDLVLEGVFVAGDPNASTAIIAAGREAGELYHPGDLLPGNAVLTAVQERQVLLTRGGALETLGFPEAEPLDGARVDSVRNSRNP